VKQPADRWNNSNTKQAGSHPRPWCRRRQWWTQRSCRTGQVGRQVFMQ
jgi:hypothetical protein